MDLFPADIFLISKSKSTYNRFDFVAVFLGDAEFPIAEIR